MISAKFQNEAIEKDYLRFKSDWKKNDSIQVLTSGSTGEPKKILIAKEKMILSANKTIRFFNLQDRVDALVCLSLNTIAGKMMLARAFVGKWNLTIVEPAVNPLLNSDENIDFLALVPLQLERILIECPDKIRQIETVIVGGAPVSNSLINLLKENEMTVYQTFGMTETVSHIALRKIGKETDAFYKTVDGAEVSDLDGNLIIHYPEMFEEPLRTNDLVKIISPKQFEWLGRSDYMINSGGVKLNPEKIEQKLSELIPYSFFITGLKDDRLGQKLALVIENNSNFIPEKVRFQSVLDKFELPKVYINVKEFDRTKSGKVNRIKTIQNIQSNDWKAII
ncbi:MAG: AMP-binding protein [Crocinitomicaceae bacterium]|jgi:O-succinylbenzoic acid--CoA ligase